MKVPVRIDLRRASFTLCQFEENVGFTKRVGFGSGVRRSSSPITPFQIIARASVARGNRDWDRAAIVSWSCFLMGVSLSPLNSSFIMQTSRETCTASISGKLCHNSEHLQVARERESDLRKGESGEHLVHNIAVGQVVTDICFSLLLEDFYIVLKTVSQRDAKHRRDGHLVYESVNRLR